MTDAPNPTDDRWQRIADLFWEAQELPAAERGAFLDRAVPDESLRAEVEAMLAAAGDDDGRPLGLAIDETVRRAEAARDAAVERVPPSVVVVPPPTSSLRGWSKAMWLTVIVVGIGGIVAGALLAAWAIGAASAPAPAPSSAPSASAQPNVVF